MWNARERNPANAMAVLIREFRHVASGGAGGAAAPPDFGRSEGAAGQRRRAALLPNPLDF